MSISSLEAVAAGNPKSSILARGATRHSPALCFDPPTADAEWMMVPNSAQDGYLRDEVRDTLKLLKRIHGAKSKRAERKLIEQEWRGKFKAETLKRKYELFVYGGCKKRCADELCRCPDNMRFLPGDWRCLIDFARMPGGAFDHNRYSTVQFFMGFCERFQRNSRTAWRQFCMVAQGIRDRGYAIVNFTGGAREEYKAIPGLDVRDPARWNARGEFPIGCSYEQLMREAKRFGFDDYTKALARVGRFAASQFRLKVYLSRKDLPFFARLQWDDHEDNVKIKWPDSLKFLRPRGFYALEQRCSRVFSHLLKPTLWDMDNARKLALAQRDFIFFHLSVFFSVGFRNDEIGTTNILEHNTANIPERLEERIFNASGGRIRYVRSGRFGRAAHDGQYAPSAPGKGSGNPLMKAALESFFNLRDNWFAAIAGQTGKDRNHCPEQLAGVEREQRAIVAACKGMAPELAARMRNILPGWLDYQQMNAELMAAIDNSRDHDIKDWERCNFITRKWRLTSDPNDPRSQQWVDLNGSEFGVSGFELMQERFLADPSLTCDVRMSRREAFQHETRNAKQLLTPLPWHCLPELLGEEHAIENRLHADSKHEDTLVVKEGRFHFTNQYWGPGTWRFEAINREGRRLYNGQRYKCFGIPFLPECIVACDAQLRLVGVCPRVPDVNPLDQPALERALARQAAWEAEARTDLDARHEREARHIEEVRSHNAALVEEGRTGMTAAEQRSHKRTLRGKATGETVHDLAVLAHGHNSESGAAPASAPDTSGLNEL